MNSLKKRILIVDDDSKITRLVRLNLEQTGEYEVKEENSGRHAFAAAREFHPDLILLDLSFPDADGGELAHGFQESPRFREVPIILLLALGTHREVFTHGGKLGGFPFLAKPVGLPELVACLRSHLEKPAVNPALGKTAQIRTGQPGP